MKTAVQKRLCPRGRARAEVTPGACFWIHFTGATTVCGPCVVTNDQFRLLMIVSTNLTGIP